MRGILQRRVGVSLFSSKILINIIANFNILTQILEPDFMCAFQQSVTVCTLLFMHH